MVVSLIGVLDPQAPLNFIGDAGAVQEAGAPQPGVPVFSSPARSVEALAAVVRYQRWRQDGVGEPLVPEGLEGSAASKRADELLDGWLSANSGTELRRLSAEQCRELLEVYGLSPLASEPFESEDEAVDLAAEIGYPVALKATNAYLRHRLDLGGVRLSIADEPMLRRAVQDMREDLSRYGATELEIQAMAPPGQGCMVRAIEDPLMGPVVSFGISGDAVDLLDDWAHAVPPLTDKDLRRLIRRPRAAVKLQGHQGIPGVDMGSLEDTLQRIAMLKDNHPQVALIEVAPLLASAEGTNLLHVRIEIADYAQRTDSARRALSQY